MVRPNRRKGGQGEGQLDENDPLDPEYASVVQKALLSSPLLKGCDSLVDQLVTGAQQCSLERNKELQLGDDQPLYVVVAGALACGVATGTMTDIFPGSILNLGGILGLYELTAPYKPVAESAAPGAADLAAPAAGDRLAVGKDKLSQAERLSSIAILCPHARVQRTAASCSKLSGWLRLSVTAVDHPLSDDELTQGCVLATISRTDLMETLQGSQNFAANRERLTNTWLALMRNFVFPGVPVEVAWAVTEVTVLRTYNAGDDLCKEGELGDEADSIIVIDQGEAVVDKVVPGGKQVTVTNLAAGAIIGDMRLMGTLKPRPSSVKALTQVTTARLYKKKLLTILQRFPGLTSCMKGTLRDSAKLVQGSLPSRIHVLRLLRLFSMCDGELLREVAKACQRKVFYCGDAVRQVSDVDDSICLVEYGVLGMQMEEGGGRRNRKGQIVRPQVKLLGEGDVLGEEKFLGQSDRSYHVVRAVTPFAFVLTLQHSRYASLAKRYPKDQRSTSEILEEKPYKGWEVSRLDVLRQCSEEFVKAIESGVELRCFLPGQSIVVEDNADAQSMFVVQGGQAILFNKLITSYVNAGDAFGETAMLGMVRRRTATVRAETLLFAYEISRQVFLQAVEHHAAERAHFESAAAEKRDPDAQIVAWPIFMKAPERLSYFANIHAERRITAPGAWTSRKGEPLRTDAAILVLQGCVKALDEHGQELVVLNEGSCFNEHILLGLPATDCTLIPAVSSEVQIISQDAFARILEEFPEGFAWTQQSVAEEMTTKAEERHGFQRQSINVFRFSPLFRHLSDGLSRALRTKLKARLCMPGDIITQEASGGQEMFLFVDGLAYIDAGGDADKENLPVPSPSALGEAVVLGLRNDYTTTIRAQTVCLLQVLQKDDFHAALASFPADAALLADVRAQKNLAIQKHLQRHPLFSEAGQDFVTSICQHCDDVFFAPGEEIVRLSDTAHIGKGSIFVLLTGQADVENEFDIIEGTLLPGDVCGEANALNFSDHRAMTVRAWRGGLTHCGRLVGTAILAASAAYSTKYSHICWLLQERERALANRLALRRAWLQRTVYPALAALPIFAGFSEQVVEEIALALVAGSYKPGDAIFTVGEPANSLVVLAEGEAEVHARTGLVGVLTDGAVIGEAAVLGLFSQRTATVRASDRCKVCMVPAALIHAVLAKPYAAPARLAFQRVILERHQQVACGVPIKPLLQSSVTVDVISARIIALNAARTDLKRGERWRPFSESSSCGPHFSVLLRGRMDLVVGQSDCFALTLRSSCLIPDGVVASYKGSAIASTACEIYRVRMCDFLLAMQSAPSAASWSGSFHTRYSQAKELIEVKLRNARGVQSTKIWKMQAVLGDELAFLSEKQQLRGSVNMGANEGLPLVDRGAHLSKSFSAGTLLKGPQLSGFGHRASGYCRAPPADNLPQIQDLGRPKAFLADGGTDHDDMLPELSDTAWAPKTNHRLFVQ
eukprot:TRINITY_DN38914_c0_g1_i1.p1 TRINITY_DN38914_c0_g1~~TRINITY_DN38914_c0_g1_i1.p1  ORF type:complete len:1466 (-),score=306.30 TRINITY_DN38914_c0_g1_i1:60-4457(-)